VKRGAIDPARRTLFGMLLFPVFICWTLYFYYFFAQDLENPMPVEASFIIAKCGEPVGGNGRSTRTVAHSSWHMTTEYEFESRSKSFRENGKQRAARDRKTDYVEIGTFAECETAAAKANEARKPTTIWAGEDDIDSRFRARFTEKREYPSIWLLLIPRLIAGVGIWLWTRAMRKHRRFG
jgi:hypothetical protein